MNTNHLRIITLLIIAILAISACDSDGKTLSGSGDLITESREVSDFNRVSLSGTGNITIIQGEEEALTIETDDNIMPILITEVRDGTLHLEFDDDDYNSISPSKLQFTLNLVNLLGVKVSGSGDVTAQSLSTDSLEVEINGSGDVQVDSLNAETIKVEINGSGDVNLAGSTTSLVVNVSGTGEINMGDLSSQTAEATMSGSGSVTVWATETLDIEITGSGSVSYYGNPTTGTSISGSGDVNSLGDH